MYYISITDEVHQKLCELFDVTYIPTNFEPIKYEANSRSAFKGLNHTDEAKEEIRKANIGSKNPMFGLRGQKNHLYGKTKDKISCPHCNKEGGKNIMGRWHFNNCRFK